MPANGKRSAQRAVEATAHEPERNEDWVMSDPAIAGEQYLDGIRWDDDGAIIRALCWTLRRADGGDGPEHRLQAVHPMLWESFVATIAAGNVLIAKRLAKDGKVEGAH